MLEATPTFPSMYYILELIYILMPYIIILEMYVCAKLYAHRC